MNVEDAIHLAVMSHPGGADALAPRMALGAQTLRNMANPNNRTTHGWSLRRFRELLAFTGDTRPLQALCEEQGGLFVPMPSISSSQADLLKAMQHMAAEFGDVPRAIEDALQGDGKISGNELGRIELQILELVQTAARLQGVVRELHERRRALPEEDRP